MAQDPLDIAKTISDEHGKPGGYTLAAGARLGQYRIIRPLGRELDAALADPRWQVERRE